MFGFRGWHERDLEAVDADDLEGLIAAAKRYETKVAKVREAQDG